MNILITAGNTMTLIDEVRGITNVFSGRTGARIALWASARGHSVTLLTSHPDVVRLLSGGVKPPRDCLRVESYRTFDELKGSMEDHILRGRFDALIHCAAVSDYDCAGVFAPSTGTRFDPETGRWEDASGAGPKMISRLAPKVKSDHAELWVRLIPTPKLVDMVRTLWGFQGVLVKFKLEVGIPEDALIDLGERSRLQSRADLMVANTLEGMESWALLGLVEGRYHHIPRPELPARLIEAVERLHASR